MSESMLLWQLCLTFIKMSLIAIGGSDAALSAYQYEAVDHYHWLTAREFLDMFAISRAAPGATRFAPFPTKGSPLDEQNSQSTWNFRLLWLDVLFYGLFGPFGLSASRPAREI